MANAVEAAPKRNEGRRAPPPAFPVVLFGGFMVFFVAFDWASYHLPPAPGQVFTYTHGLLLVLVALVNVRVSLLLFTVSMVFCDDISRLSGSMDDTGVNNLMTVPLMGVALGNWVALCIASVAVFLALVSWPRDPRPISLNRVDKCVLVIAALYAITGLHGILNVFAQPRAALADFNSPIMICGLYAAVRLSTREDRQLLRFWRFLILAVGAKAVFWMARAALGMGVEFGTTLRVGFESGYIIFVLLLTYGLLLQSGRVRARFRERVLALGCVFCAAGVLLISAGRMGWVFAAVGLLVAFAFGNTVDKARLLVVASICGVVAVMALLRVTPDMFQTLGGMAGTLRFWEPSSVEASRSSMVRVYEFKNIHAQLLAHRNLILGEGPGSTFSDSYFPFPFPLTFDDYPYEQWRVRQFRKPHSLISSLMLRTGYGGLMVYCLIMATVAWACFRAFVRFSDPMFKAVALAMLAFFPAIVYQSWSAKNNIMLGIVLGLIGYLYAGAYRDQKGRETSTDTQ